MRNMRAKKKKKKKQKKTPKCLLCNDNSTNIISFLPYISSTCVEVLFLTYVFKATDTIGPTKRHLGITLSLGRRGASYLIASLLRFSPLDKREEKAEDTKKMITGTKETFPSLWEGR